MKRRIKITKIIEEETFSKKKRSNHRRRIIRRPKRAPVDFEIRSNPIESIRTVVDPDKKL